MNVTLTLVLAEVSLRVWATIWPTPILVTSSVPSQIRRNAGRAAPGAMRLGFPMNRGSHYDTEFAPASAARGKVAVSIGDSFSYGVVPHWFHFTTVAERELQGVDVYNMGFPGTSPTDYLFLLQHEALALKPELVVIELFMGNDVDEGPGLAGPARWYDGDSYLAAVVWFRLQIMRRAELAHAASSPRPTSSTGDQ